MKKLDNKGLTLLELIIAISILTTVIFIGYKIINKYIIVSKNQDNINQGQLTMNDLNKYLTNDLEKSTSVKLSLDRDGNGDIFNYDLIADTKTESSKQDLYKSLEDAIENEIKPLLNDDSISEFNYEYIIRDRKDSESDDMYNRYIISIIKENLSIRYSIKLIDKRGRNIDFISNKVLEIRSLPFVIIGNNTYKITIGFTNKNGKLDKYEFDITSRLNNTMVVGNDDTNNPEEGQPIEPPVEPPYPEDIDKNKSLAIGFWTADKSKFNKENNVYEKSLYTWIDNNGEFGSQDLRNQEKFYIRGDNDNGNSGKSNAYIRYNKNDRENRAVVNNTSSKANNIEKIKIYVSPYTTLDNIEIYLGSAKFDGIKEVGKLEYLNNINNKYTLQGKSNGTWYEVILTKSSNDKVNFRIDGELYIDKENISSGYGMIVYGEQSNSDIVYEWENDGDGYKVNAYATVGSDKTKRNEKQYNKIRNMSIQIDKGSQPPIIRSRGINSEIATSDSKFEDIKAIKLKIDGKLILSDIKFNGNKVENLNSSNEFIVLELNPNQKSNNLEANFNFSKMGKNRDFGKLLVDFIY